MFDKQHIVNRLLIFTILLQYTYFIYVIRYSPSQIDSTQPSNAKKTPTTKIITIDQQQIEQPKNEKIPLSALFPNRKRIIDIWPQPHKFTQRDITYQFGSDFEFQTFHHSKETHDDMIESILQNAYKKYQKIIFHQPSECTHQECIKGLKIFIIKPSKGIEYPTLDMDESYILSLQASESYFVLRSPTVWGALRGLETFSQLVKYKDNVYTVKSSMIRDKPRYQWRGLMIDTSRHYLEVDTILRIIDGMSFHKLNTLHWYMVGDESFPLVLEKHPELSKQGAYSPRMVYTHSDVKKIVEYARLHGIRVVPEIPLPGHVKSWSKAYPSIISPHCKETKHPLLNIDKSTFSIIHDIVEELSRLFPDPYIHFGGDDLQIDCWPKDARCKLDSNLHSYSCRSSLVKFERELQKIYKKYKKKMVRWEDIVLKQNKFLYPKNTIVQVSHSLAEVADKQLKIVYSSNWYLNDTTKPWMV